MHACCNCNCNISTGVPLNEILIFSGALHIHTNNTHNTKIITTYITQNTYTKQLTNYIHKIQHKSKQNKNTTKQNNKCQESK